MPLALVDVFAPRSHWLQTALLVSLCCGACSADEKPVGLPSPSGSGFADDVYPVLLRDCGMSQCHGAETRFFRVVGPGRARLSEDTDALAPVTPQEILFSYDRAISMLEPAPHTGQSLLLRKPLDPRAGGASHEGRDAYGRNVYAETTAPGYRAIATWALGAMNAVDSDAGVER